MSNLIIASPLNGWAAPLEEVDDAVFAERMMGDGLAIDPTDGVLYAPFDGQVTSMPQTGHAVVVRAESGPEMLMHVGLETVALGGEGFIAHVCEGQRVRAGERLLSFDLDLLAQRAKSLMTPIILTNGEAFDIVARHQDRRVAVGEPLLEIRLRGAAEVNAAGEGSAQRAAKLGFEHGLHARPAATVAKVAQGFRAEISVSANGRRANAKSPVSLMILGAAQGGALAIEAHGADAEGAAEAVAQALSTRSAAAPAMRAMPETPRATPSAPGVIAGVCAAPGVALGVATHLRTPDFVAVEAGRGAELERAALNRALARVKAAMTDGAHKGAERDILNAHAALLDDAELGADAERAIAAGKSAAFAWKAAIARQAAALGALNDPYLAGRVADLRDIEMQVLVQLQGATVTVQTLPDNAIVLAAEILPSQFAAFDRAKLAGICMAGGGVTAHVALLAAAAGVPALVAAGRAVLEIEEGAALLLDATAGVLRVSPPEAETRAALASAQARRVSETAARAHAQEECRTADGVRIQIYANLASAEDAVSAIALGAEGCGLLRTEFLFMDRQAPPTSEEQRTAYQAVAQALGERALVIRTLDAAPDKPVAYLPATHEDNPALGLRGLRASLRQPELLADQLRAICAVSPRPKILLPMVTDVADVHAVRALMATLGLEAELGVMIETPSAALLADQLAEAADFLSLGTNDLSQYALAMDRGHPDLAGAIDALHPAVLRLIKAAADGAKKYAKPLSVCGAAASDLAAAPLLIGFGIETLSAAPASIPALKAKLRTLTLAACRAAAEAALELADARAVRALAASLGAAP